MRVYVRYVRMSVCVFKLTIPTFGAPSGMGLKRNVDCSLKEAVQHHTRFHHSFPLTDAQACGLQIHRHTYTYTYTHMLHIHNECNTCMHVRIITRGTLHYESTIHIRWGYSFN